MTETRCAVAKVVFSAALGLTMFSCGGGGGSCGKVQPCGGNVVGNYTVSGACFDSAAVTMQIGMQCPGASANISALNVSGNASFNADLTYSITETISASLSETIPPSCLTANGITITCAQLDQEIQLLLAQQPGTYQSAHCSGSGTCTCSFTLAAQTMSETGTYTTSGTTITTTDSTGTSSSSSYCAQGNQLHMLQVDMTMAMGKIQGDVVFTKK
jgi:hypothetical protein